MLVFYCVFAMIVIVCLAKDLILISSLLDQYKESEEIELVDPNFIPPVFDLPDPKKIEPLQDLQYDDMHLAADAVPFWRYYESNGKSRRKRCKMAFYKFKAKLKRRKSK